MNPNNPMPLPIKQAAIAVVATVAEIINTVTPPASEADAKAFLADRVAETLQTHLGPPFEAVQELSVAQNRNLLELTEKYCRLWTVADGLRSFRPALSDPEEEDTHTALTTELDTLKPT